MEEVAIATVPIPQRRPELFAAPELAAATGGQPSLLTVGDVDYEVPLHAAQAAVDIAISAPVKRAGIFPPLDGTRAEIVAIVASFAQQFPGAQSRSLCKDQANKVVVCGAMEHYRYLHLATLGFFAPPEMISALANGLPRLGIERSSKSASDGVVGFHPDLLSGLAARGSQSNGRAGKSGRHPDGGGRGRTGSQSIRIGHSLGL